MKISTAIAGGFAGSFALTLLHQALRFTNKNAPHMDELGMEAIAKTLNKADIEVPEENKLYGITMVGDLLGNGAYYAAAGLGSKKQVWVNGIVLGLLAGVGGVLLPKPMGLNEQQSTRTTETKALTVVIYLFGGLVASAVMNAIENDQE